MISSKPTAAIVYLLLLQYSCCARFASAAGIPNSRAIIDDPIAVQSANVSICAPGCTDFVDIFSKAFIISLVEKKSEGDGIAYYEILAEAADDATIDVVAPSLIIVADIIASWAKIEPSENMVEKIEVLPVSELEDTCKQCIAGERSRHLQDDDETGLATIKHGFYGPNPAANIDAILEEARVDGIVVPAKTVGSVYVPICAAASQLDLEKIARVAQSFVLGIYGLIVAVIIQGSIVAPQNGLMPYTFYKGFGHLATGLACGLSGLAAVANDDLVEQEIIQCNPGSRRNLKGNESGDFRLSNLKIDFFFDSDGSPLPTLSDIENALRDGADEINQALKEAGVNGIVFPGTDDRSSKKGKSNKKKTKKKSKPGKKGKKVPKKTGGADDCFCDDGCCNNYDFCFSRNLMNWVLCSNNLGAPFPCVCGECCDDCGFCFVEGAQTPGESFRKCDQEKVDNCFGR